jgi:hypothetical protein
LEGGLQQKPTPLLARQHHAQRVRNENDTGKTGRLRPDWKPQDSPEKWREDGSQVIFYETTRLLKLQLNE